MTALLVVARRETDMTHALVDSLDKVIENIARYQSEVGREPRLVGRMKMVRAWYADRANDGKWLFGPSKFVGYASCTAEAYLSKTDKRDTYRSEAALKEWFGCRSHIDSSCGTFAWKRHHVAGDDDLLTIGLGEQRPRLVEA